MTGRAKQPGITLDDVAAWARAFEVDGSPAIAQVIPALTKDERGDAIVHLISLVSIALEGTGGREPVEWLTRLIEHLGCRGPDV